VLDELFTKLEKAICHREQALMHAMQRVSGAESTTLEHRATVDSLAKHSSKEQTQFQSQLQRQVVEMEREARQMASMSEFCRPGRDAGAEQLSEFSGKELDTERQLGSGPNFSSVIFNNSVAEAIDVARQNEVAIGLTASSTA